MMIIVIACMLLISVLGIQYLQLQRALTEAEKRLASYNPKTISLEYGEMTYVDAGSGPAVLVAHGMSGGYDQGYETLRGKEEQYRILAPSRFGYLGSSVPWDTSPKAQAAAYAQFLDKLGIERTYILGTSAGGTVAIRFALDYPERTLGLILYSSAMPFTEKPATVKEYQGPPAFLCNDFAMWMFRPLFEPMMGMDPDTIYQILPVSKRSSGMQIDASIVNPDMGKNYEQYPVENLQIPTLIIGAKDDKLSDFYAMEKAASRFLNSTLIGFDDGGHMMVGHGEEIEKALDEFMNSTNQ